jgi:hypothetical protein
VPEVTSGDEVRRWNQREPFLSDENIVKCA